MITSEPFGTPVSENPRVKLFPLELILDGVDDNKVATPPSKESKKSAASKLDGFALSLKTVSDNVTVI